MRLFNTTVAAYLIIAASLPAFAEDKKTEPKGFSGAAEFGMVLTSGNTDTSTTTGRFEVSYDLEKWLHFARFNIVNSEVDNATTAERYLLNLKSDYKMDDDQFLFAGATHDIDKFSGFDSQSTIATGYGRKLYDTETLHLSAEIGPGYRTSKLDDGSSDSEAILHLGSKGKYIVNEYSHFVADLNIDAGSNQTITVFNIGYVNKLNNALALKLAYNIKKSSNVPVGTDNTDTITSVNLLYSF